MRITLEPTAAMMTGEHAQHKVIVEAPYDDVDLDGMIELFWGAMAAYGFSMPSIEEYFNHE